MNKNFHLYPSAYFSLPILPNKLLLVPLLDPLLEDGSVEPVKGYVSGRRGKYSMVDQRNFLYYFHVPYKNKMRWRCIYCTSYKGQKIKCNAGVYTIKNNIVKFINEHNHPPTYDSSEKLDLTPSE